MPCTRERPRRATSCIAVTASSSSTEPACCRLTPSCHACMRARSWGEAKSESHAARSLRSLHRLLACYTPLEWRHTEGAVSMARVDPPTVINVADLRDAAKRRLPRVVFDYID